MHPRNVLAWRAVRWLKAQGVPIVWTWLGPYHDRWLIADRERPYEHQPHPEWLIYTVRAALLRTLRDRRLRENFRNYAIHQPLQHVDAFIPCSRHEATALAALGFGDRPMTVVPLWLDMQFMLGPAPALHLPLTHPIIPYIGQLTVRKCYDMVIEAMPAVVARYPAASFVFVTHNPEQRANLQRIAGERGMAANLHFLGMISEEEKLALLRASDVLPFPSRYEGFGLPLLEGMAAGTPVISTDIPVVNEIIEHGENGLLIPYDDSAALARAILDVLDNADLRAQLVAGGRRSMIERFDPRALVERVVEVYQAVQSRSS
jgi:glycogen(starch) synthase